MVTNSKARQPRKRFDVTPRNFSASVALTRREKLAIQFAANHGAGSRIFESKFPAAVFDGSNSSVLRELIDPKKLQTLIESRENYLIATR